MATDYSKGRYNIFGPARNQIGRIDEDEYVRQEGRLLYRIEGDEIYSMQGKLLGLIDDGSARSLNGNLLFTIESE